MSHDTIPSRLFDQGRSRPTAPAWQARGPDGRWRVTTWSAYADEVRAVARALIALDVLPGDRVCILGFNRSEWTTMALAAMAVGAIPAGIYTTCSANEVAWIVAHAEAPVILVEDRAQLAKITAERAAMPELRHVVLMRGAEAREGTIGWDELLKHGGASDAELETRLAALRPEDDATFIYTSGTTGPPKAVRLTHDNLVWTATIACGEAGITADEHMISYLPLSHIAEQLFSIHVHVTAGYTLSFAESMERLRENIQEVRPTVLFGVPRVWEKMHAAFVARLSGAPPARKALANWAMGVGRAVADLRNRGQQPGPWLRLQHGLARRLVFRRIRSAIGFDRLRFGVSGAAPIAREVLELFAGLDILIHEVYGQSEDTGPTSMNLPGATRFGTVGRPLRGVEVRTAPDGEVLVRGRNVFAGYYKDEAATREAMVDGWLASGDLGVIDAEGFLSITGRKKEIIITAGGKNISPANIEGLLKGIPLISQAVVIGDRRPYLIALLTLDPIAAEQLANQLNLHPSALPTQESVLQQIQEGIDTLVNPQLARVEHVRRFAILPRELSQDHGELTPTLKIKRRAVAEHFAREIDAVYRAGEPG
jgi:long-chain acyl-CoA synthetase